MFHVRVRYFHDMQTLMTRRPNIVFNARRYFTFYGCPRFFKRFCSAIETSNNFAKYCHIDSEGLCLSLSLDAP